MTTEWKNEFESEFGSIITNDRWEEYLNPEIIEFIEKLLDKKDQQRKEEIELIIKYCQCVVEVQQLENHINNK